MSRMSAVQLPDAPAKSEADATANPLPTAAATEVHGTADVPQEALQAQDQVALQQPLRVSRWSLGRPENLTYAAALCYYVLVLCASYMIGNSIYSVFTLKIRTL